jgi:hypothetical protein
MRSPYVSRCKSSTAAGYGSFNHARRKELVIHRR